MIALFVVAYVDAAAAEAQTCVGDCDRDGISGVWLEDDLRLVSSSCPRAVTNAVRADVARLLPCEYQLSLDGDRVNSVSCRGTSSSRPIDPSGVVSSFERAEQTPGGCTVVVESRATIDLSRSPTVEEVVFDVDLSGRCTFSDCRFTLHTTWTRL